MVEKMAARDAFDFAARMLGLTGEQQLKLGMIFNQIVKDAETEIDSQAREIARLSMILNTGWYGQQQANARNLAEIHDLRSRLESAERERDEWRQAVVAVCDQHEEYKREQGAILSQVCDKAIADHRKRAQSQSNQQRG